MTEVLEELEDDDLFRREGTMPTQGVRVEPAAIPLRKARNIVPFVRPSNHQVPEDPKGPRDAAAANTEGQPPRDERPTIQLSTELHDNTTASIAALSKDPDTFQRDARLVRIIRVADVDAEREKMSAGTPQIRDISNANMRERLTRVAKYEKFDMRAGGWMSALPPDSVVAALLDRREWPGIRPIAGIVDAPSIRPDGSALDVPGYDAATGYLYAPRRRYPAVPAHPTIDQARAALQDLLEPWNDFPFAEAAKSAPKATRYVPVAALMTLVARPAIRGACPGILFDASTRGSGKSLLARAVTLLAHGREAALMSWPTKQDELEKVLGAYALKGASVIAFDNVAAEFGGAPIDKVLTCADRVELRVLGKSNVPDVAWRAVVLAGGNNMAVGADTTRRVLIARLEPMMERPEERTGYRIADLASWCTEHHPRIVVSCLTVLRAYMLAGSPSQNLAGWGSFEAWRDLIGSAIVWAGGDDVMACRPTIAGKDDTETGALRSLLCELESFADGVSINVLMLTLYSPERMRGGKDVRPDGRDALREALETLAPPKSTGLPPDRQKLGIAFARLLRRVVGGRFLERHSETKGNVAKWVVRKVGGA